METRSDSQLSTEQVFSNIQNAENAMVGVYNSMMQERAFRNTLVGPMMTNTDAEIYSSTKSSATIIARYSYSTSLTEVGMNQSNASDPWSRLYHSIELCNHIIAYIPQYGDMSNERFQYLYGEALTLRAFFYSTLIKTWGDVPGRFEPMTNSTIYVGKMPRAEMYAKLFADLDEAEKNVPWAGEINYTATVERVNKEFVKGLKARIALAAAGKALLPSGTYGEIDYVFDNASDRENLMKLVLKETDEILASTSFKLAATYDKVFKDQCADVISTGRESIFEIPSSTSRGEFMSFLAHKRDVSESDNKDPYTDAKLNGRIYMNPALFYGYEKGDLRRDICVLPYYFTNGTAKFASNANTLYLSKWRVEWMNRTINSKDDGVNPMIMRLADIYLMNAEANIYFDNLSEARTKIKAVRSRCFETASQASASVDAAVSKEDLLKFLQKERAYEFIGEGLRRWDLMRWGILKETLDESNEGMKALRPTDSKTYISVWYRKSTENVFDVWGLNEGETEANLPQDGGKWTKVEKWIQSTSFSNYINALYDSNNVFTGKDGEFIRDLMPIMPTVTTNAQIKNDYNY